MDIRVYSVGQLQENCYIVSKKGECLIIDPGDESSFLLEEAMRENLTPVAILLTHAHFDHCMAAGEMQMSFDIPLYMHNKDIFLLKRMRETAEHFLGHAPAIVEPKSIRFFSPGQFSIFNFKFKIISTPGHTPGGVSFYFEKEGVVFTGDTLFKGTVGRWDFSYCDKKKLKKSVETLLKLPPETRILSGHGEETTVGEETNTISVFG